MMEVKVMEVKKLALIFGVIVVAALANGSHGVLSPSKYSPELKIRVPVANSISLLNNSFYPAIFGFGSSVVDTGTNVIIRVNSPAGNYPYGITFPGYSSGRWSDGRLLIDFLAEAFGLPYLDPFIKSGTSNFRQGANFASAGCTATDNFRGSAPTSFNIGLQLYQFKQFKSQVLATNRDRAQKITDCSSPLPPESVFREALYVISTGGNDILDAVKKGAPMVEIRAAIPGISAAIMRVAEGLYEEGARNIMVEDVYPLACLPIMGDVNETFLGAAETDADGCAKFMDELVLMHNSLLKEMIDAFAQTHSADLSIALIDTYSIRRDLMINPLTYGFKYGIRPCCGVDGQYKGDEKCGTSSRALPCADPSGYVIWDGQHYTEAANRFVANAILSGNQFKLNPSPRAVEGVARAANLKSQPVQYMVAAN